MLNNFSILSRLALCAACFLAVVSLTPAIQHLNGSLTGQAEMPGHVQEPIRNVSSSGAQAFTLIRDARRKLFDGLTQDAEELVAAATRSLARAKEDDTAYMKKHAALKTIDGKRPAGDATQPPTAWIPVDGSLTFGEHFEATPEQRRQIEIAKIQAGRSDMKKAAELLQQANVDFRLALVVAPLEQTIRLIGETSKLIAAGKYYEANLKLKQAQDGLAMDIGGE
jgi:hypothetical protein